MSTEDQYFNTQEEEEESPPNGRHDGRRLRDILKRLNLNVNEFAEKPYLDKSRPAAYVLLRKANFSREELALVCYLFNLEVTDFDYPLDYLLTPFNKNRLLERHNSVAAFHALAAHPESEELSGSKFLKGYFDDLARYTSQATSRLRIYHYLGKAKYHIKPYVLQQYERYYLEIESTMASQPELRYERFAALPIQLVEGPEIPSDPEIKVFEILTVETIRHIARCLSFFGDRFSFYAISIPSRLNSFTLVDDKYVISEYDRLNRHRKASNDLMFVDRVTPSLQQDLIAGLWRVYSNDLDNLVREPDSSARRKISLERVLEVVFNQLTKAEKGIQEKKQELDQVQNSLQLEIFGGKSIESASQAVKLKEELEKLESSRTDWEQKLAAVKDCLKKGDLSENGVN